MGGDGSSSVVDTACAVLDGLRTLASADLDALSGDDFDLLLLVHEQGMRVGGFVQQRLAGHADHTDLASSRGHGKTIQYLRDVLRIGPGEARARLRAVDRWHPRQALTGETLQPRYPVVAEAVRDGQISTRHAETVTSAVHKLPAALGAETRTDAEAFLVEKARQLDPPELSRYAKVLASYLDPDGVLTEEREQKQREAFTLTTDVHGMWRAEWAMTVETKNLLDVVLGPLSTPQGSKQEPDPRSPERRRSDAMVQVLQHALTTADLPKVAGRRPHVTLTASLKDLLERQGVARLNSGDLVSRETVGQALCDADVNLAVLGGRGKIMYFGRTRRTASDAQKHALLVRDGGCVFDGCTTNPEHLKAHHVQWWARDLGDTDLDKMCLVCDHDHDLIHHHGYQIQITKGTPAVIPPPWIDPEQRPRFITRNLPPKLGP